MPTGSLFQKISIFTAIFFLIQVSSAETTKVVPLNSSVERVTQTLENNDSFRENVTVLYKKLIAQKQNQTAQVDFQEKEILVLVKEAKSNPGKVLLHFIEVKKYLDENNSILHRFVVESDLAISLPENPSSTDIEESINNSSLELSDVQSSTSQLKLKKQ